MGAVPHQPLPIAEQRAERGDAAANRVRILAAARRLLEEEGPAHLSMDAVAVAAGVGKGTIFRRFGDRPGLMEQLINAHMQDFQDAFLTGPPPLGPGAPPAARLEAFFVALVQMQGRHLPLALAAEMRPPAEPARGAFAPLLLHVRILLGALDPTLNAPVIAPMLLGMIAPPVLDSLQREGHDGGALEAAVIMALRGVTAHPG